MRNSKVYDMVVTALLTALTYLLTRFINIPLPFALNGGGLVHLGNVMIVISAVVFGKRKTAASAAFGMAIFDLTSGYAVWAPFTFVIRGVMGYVMGYISDMKNGSNVFFNAVAVIVSGIIMIVGYYLAQVVLYGSWIAPMTGVPGDVIQVLVGLIVGIPVASVIKKYAPEL